MNFNEFKTVILQLDPYEHVEVVLDEFRPYSYFELSAELQELYEKMLLEDRDKYDEWISEMVDYTLQKEGISGWK